MYLTHKIKLKPTIKQQEALVKTAGVCRYAYNWAIDETKRQYEEYKNGTRTNPPNRFSLQNAYVTSRPDWAYEVNSTSQYRAVFDAWTAYLNFFKKTKWRYPTYKKKSAKDSFYLSNQAIGEIRNHRVRILRVGKVKITEELRFSGKIVKGVISRDGNDWYIAITVDTQITRPSAQNDSTVGIDVGLKHIAVTSDGYFLDSPTALKNLNSKKRTIQKSLDRSKKVRRCVNGVTRLHYSNNGKKKLKRLRSVQSRINNIKNDITNKFTTAICKNHANVVVESLQLLGLIKGADKKTTKSFSNSMIWKIFEQLRYKASNLIHAPRFFPSSKRCSVCGHIKEDLTITDRTYVCPHCGNSIDRDLNAAINLKNTPWVTGEVPDESMSVKTISTKQEDHRV